MKKITLPDLPGESRKYLLFPRTTELIQQRPESLFHGNDLRGPESICPCKKRNRYPMFPLKALYKAAMIQ